jgi:DNA-directed RNA polymerase subunit L
MADMEDKLSKAFACVEDESGCSVTCTFTDEGHTLGNVLRYAITKKY